MRVNTLWKRLKTNLRDPQMRANVLALAGGKAIGLTLVLTKPDSPDRASRSTSLSRASSTRASAA